MTMIGLRISEPSKTPARVKGQAPAASGHSPIDLVERRIASAFRAAAIDFPVSITGFGNLALGEGGVAKHERG
jgi:hypothetical protein